VVDTHRRSAVDHPNWPHAVHSRGGSLKHGAGTASGEARNGGGGSGQCRVDEAPCAHGTATDSADFPPWSAAPAARQQGEQPSGEGGRGSGSEEIDNETGRRGGLVGGEWQQPGKKRSQREGRSEDQDGGSSSEATDSRGGIVLCVVYVYVAAAAPGPASPSRSATSRRATAEPFTR
jgi:hypothetical protein